MYVCVYVTLIKMYNYLRSWHSVVSTWDQSAFAFTGQCQVKQMIGHLYYSRVDTHTHTHTHTHKAQMDKHTQFKHTYVHTE